MKHVLLSAVVAAVISVAIVRTLENGGPPEAALPTDEPAAAPVPTVENGTKPLRLRYTDALVEDVWINGARTPGDDHRSLSSAENSICFITKIEIGGIRSADDTSSCVMQIDDFTGFWDLVATVDDDSQSEIRCNARCLIWE